MFHSENKKELREREREILVEADRRFRGTCSNHLQGDG
jgi:hypothetical protein